MLSSTKTKLLAGVALAGSFGLAGLGVSASAAQEPFLVTPAVWADVDSGSLEPMVRGGTGPTGGAAQASVELWAEVDAGSLNSGAGGELDVRR